MIFAGDKSEVDTKVDAYATPKKSQTVSHYLENNFSINQATQFSFSIELDKILNGSTTWKNV